MSRAPESLRELCERLEGEYRYATMSGYRQRVVTLWPAELRPLLAAVEAGRACAELLRVCVPLPDLAWDRGTPDPESARLDALAAWDRVERGEQLRKEEK